MVSFTLPTPLHNHQPQVLGDLYEIISFSVDNAPQCPLHPLSSQIYPHCLIYFRVRMKINLSYPATGCQKLIEIADELKVRLWTRRTNENSHVTHEIGNPEILGLDTVHLAEWYLFRPISQCHAGARVRVIELSFQVRPFYEKRMGQEVEADTLGDEFKVTLTMY